MKFRLLLLVWCCLQIVIWCEWQSAQLSIDDEEEELDDYFDEVCDTSGACDTIRPPLGELSTDEEEEDLKTSSTTSRAVEPNSRLDEPKLASRELAKVLARQDFIDMFQQPSGIFWTKYWEQEPAFWRTDGFYRETIGQLSWKFIEQSNLMFTQEGNEANTPSFKRYAGAFYKKSKIAHSGLLSGKQLLESLQDGETIVFGSVHKWHDAVLQFIKWFGNLCGRRTNANAYLIKHGAKVGLDVHNDQHDFLVSQLEGSKRWEVWVKPDKFLPLGMVSQSHGTQKKMAAKDIKALGTPDINVTLLPGDFLYVPRGAVHLTNTEEGSGNTETNYSLHVTTAIAVDGFSLPWVVGAGEYNHIPQHQYFTSAYIQAATQLQHKDVSFRHSVRMKENTHLYPDSKEDIRKALHAIVDEVIDHTEFVAAIEDRLGYVRHIGRQQSWEAYPKPILNAIQP